MSDTAWGIAHQSDLMSRLPGTLDNCVLVPMAQAGAKAQLLTVQRSGVREIGLRRNESMQRSPRLPIFVALLDVQFDEPIRNSVE